MKQLVLLILGGCFLIIGMHSNFSNGYEIPKWTKPANLGSVINSPYNEKFPMFPADGQSLYFASDRTGGAGEYDLYRSTKQADSKF